MNSYKYLIIGGGLAGASAVDVIRKVDSDGSMAQFYCRPRKSTLAAALQTPLVKIEKGEYLIPCGNHSERFKYFGRELSLNLYLL